MKKKFKILLFAQTLEETSNLSQAFIYRGDEKYFHYNLKKKAKMSYKV